MEKKFYEEYLTPESMEIVVESEGVICSSAGGEMPEGGLEE